MNDYLRELLYPLGFLAAAAFSARMLVQWLSSEARGQSFVMPIFWKLSLAGNLLLAGHAFIQVQFHVCVIQMCNAVISWRNLNLMQPAAKQISTRRTLCLLLLALIATFAAFQWQDHILMDNSQGWFRIPTAPWQQIQKKVNLGWHIFGFTGLALFGSRFWMQWWCAERRRTSYLGPAFWWTSLIGEGMCLIYFVRIGDAVNYIGPACAMIPYIRNLMLLSKQNKLPAGGTN